MQIGARVALDRNALLAARDGEVQIGDDTYIGIGVVIVARERITIGRHVLIAEYTSIRDQDHVYGVDLLTSESGFRTAPIVIGNNVWIGAKATITKGVSIGDNAVIGANAVVTHDVPPGAVAVGVPARVIRQLS